jgi:hypothetical protein
MSHLEWATLQKKRPVFTEISGLLFGSHYILKIESSNFLVITSLSNDDATVLPGQLDVITF